MPKKSAEQMAARRAQILAAARRCFARKGFAATTISNLAREAGVSAGGIYTHFANKHAIAAAIGGHATTSPGDSAPLDLIAMFDALQSEGGLVDAQLDLNLWATSIRDPEMATMVEEAMDRTRTAVRASVPKRRRSAGRLALLEAIMLGVEVQRALGRPQPRTLKAELRRLLEDADA